MSKFELVIFDCDGVLVDSERIANEVFGKILNEECGFSAGMSVFGYAELMYENRLKEAGAHHTFNNMVNLSGEIERFVQSA